MGDDRIYHLVQLVSIYLCIVCFQLMLIGAGGQINQIILLSYSMYHYYFFIFFLTMDVRMALFLQNKRLQFYLFTTMEICIYSMYMFTSLTINIYLPQ
jgi:hypothetical protein